MIFERLKFLFSAAIMSCATISSFDYNPHYIEPVISKDDKGVLICEWNSLIYHTNEECMSNAVVYYNYKESGETRIITDEFTSSLNGAVFTEAGTYIETLNGERGTIHREISVYDYGDINGDYKITAADAVLLMRIVGEDPVLSHNYQAALPEEERTKIVWENTDCNQDDYLNILDAAYITKLYWNASI